MTKKIDLIESLGSKELTDLSKDILEVGLDSILKDGLLKDIPIIGSVINVFNLSKKIKESFEASKILKFLIELDGIPQDKTDQFKEKLENDKVRNHVGEQILLIISRLNEIDKATYIGKLFKLYIENGITQSDFFRLSNMISDAFLGDFEALEMYTQAPHVQRNIDRDVCIQQLYKVGLYDQKVQLNTIKKLSKAENEQRLKVEYRLNRFGTIIQSLYMELKKLSIVSHEMIEQGVDTPKRKRRLLDRRTASQQ